MPETSHCEWVFSCRMTRASQYLMLPLRRLCDLSTEVLLNGCRLLGARYELRPRLNGNWQKLRNEYNGLEW